MQRIMLAGAGYVGLNAARRLERLLHRDEAEVVVVNPENFMLFRPLLPEVASGSIEPRHAVVPLRDVLERSRVVPGAVTGLDESARTVTIDTTAGHAQTWEWDQFVLGLGSMSRVLPVPGLAKRALGFSSIAEAVGLRNHVLGCLERAVTLTGEERARALTFVFVGGGYTGVEALAELHDMAMDVLVGYPDLEPDEVRFVLVEATGRLLPTVSIELADHARAKLARRGIEIRLQTRLDRVDDELITLSDGSVLPADTLVWVTGVVPDPIVGELGLPIEDDGRLRVAATLRVEGRERVWAAGDCAAVPDVEAGGTCPPTAQYAARQGRLLGDNLAAATRGGTPIEFRHRSLGEFVTLGNRRGVAEVMGRRVAGFPAWLLRRAYYGSQIPTLNRKTRLLLDWAVGMPFGHDVVDLSSEQDPRAPFRAAAESRHAGRSAGE